MSPNDRNSTAIEFEEYDVTSKHYDSGRIPVGAELYKKHLGNEKRLLDCGCGTGNYLFALAPLCKEAVGLELNDGMIAQARKKLAGTKAANVVLQQGSLLEDLPFESASFDVATINQVIHHLDQDHEQYPNVEQLCKRIAKVLKPGGLLMMNTCSPEQCKRGVWYSQPFPKAAEHYSKRYIPIDLLKKYLNRAGFDQVDVVSTPDTVMSHRAYWNLAGPLEKEWRDLDSFFADVDAEELKAGLSSWRSALEKCEAGARFDAMDKHRMDIGSTTFVFARKQA